MGREMGIRQRGKMSTFVGWVFVYTWFGGVSESVAGFMSNLLSDNVSNRVETVNNKRRVFFVPL
jgi:hypothetical protein